MAKKLLLLSLLLSPTQIIKMPWLEFSLFQISLIITFAVCVLKPKRLAVGLYPKLSFIYAISCIVPFFTSISPNVISNFLVAIMTCLLMFSIPVFFELNELSKLEKFLIRSQYIVIPFSFLSLFYFYQRGGIPEHLDLVGGLYIDFDEEAALRGVHASEIRLMLPYATPPVLSVIMAMSIVLLYYNKQLFANKIRICLIILFSTIMILTGSRSGVYGLAVLIVLRLLSNGFSFKTILYTTAIGIFLCIFLYISSQIEYLSKFINKMQEIDPSNLSEDRHLLVPIDGILLWLDSPGNFLFGIGYGSSEFMEGAHTYLPPYFLNSFVTLIAERGILGLLVVVFIIRTTYKLYKIRTKLNNSEQALLYAFITVLASTMFYETFNNYVIIYLIAIVMVLEKILYVRRLN